ncbi:TraC family protein, partial [Mesorhizobium sp. M00.F.Ca.ET.149.01.1.1]
GRMGPIALKAGLGELEIEEAALQAAVEETAKRCRGGKGEATVRKNAGDGRSAGAATAAVEAGAAAPGAGKA